LPADVWQTKTELINKKTVANRHIEDARVKREPMTIPPLANGAKYWRTALREWQRCLPCSPLRINGNTLMELKARKKTRIGGYGNECRDD
jgi:hypothetical protein